MANPFKDGKKPIKFVTPFGTAGFTALSAPFKRDGDDNGKYECKLRFEGADADKMAALLDDLCEQDKADRGKKVQKPYVWEEDEETDERTGVLIVNFKATAGGVIRHGARAGQTWEHRIRIRQPEPGSIGAGSELAIQFTVRQTEFGKKHYLNLQPVAVKVRKLVAFGGGFDDDGFFDGDDDLIEADSVFKAEPSDEAPQTSGNSAPVANASADEDEDF